MMEKFSLDRFYNSRHADELSVPEHVTSNNSIKPKYMGNAADQEDMQRLGRVQRLRRNFSVFTMTAFTCSLIATWEFLAALIQFALTDGGTAGLIWGYLIVLTGYFLVYLSLSEMASMSPTSGGQYHWVSEFAPRSCQKYLSYITGYLCATGWQCSISSTSFLGGTILQGIVTLNYQNYNPQRWQGSLMVIAVVAFSVIFNTIFAKRLPMVQGFSLIINIIGPFAIIITLWAMAPRSSAHAVFTQFTNNGGWSSTGVSVLIGMSQITSSLAGFDCAVHMAEEVRDASRTLPKAILSAVAINGVLGFLVIVTLSFTLGNVDSILATRTGYPFIQVIYNGTHSYAGATVLVSIVVVTFTAAVIAEIATASRQLWSFARDRGLPFSKFFDYIPPNRAIPLNAVFTSFLIGSLLSLINIGSTVALNAINSLTISAILLSYMITISCLLMRRIRGDPLPSRRWTLGRYGMAINFAAMGFLCVMFVFVFFPLATPVDAQSMNWGCTMLGGIIILASLYYLVRGRKVYRPPVVILRKE